MTHDTLREEESVCPHKDFTEMFRAALFATVRTGNSSNISPQDVVYQHNETMFSNKRKKL